jgi:hypothetical protein
MAESVSMASAIGDDVQGKSVSSRGVVGRSETFHGVLGEGDLSSYACRTDSLAVLRDKSKDFCKLK